MPVQNAEIAAMFDQAAKLLEIKGDNPFRTRTYRRAARVIESLPKSAEGMLRAGEDLSELPGIGEDLAGKIAAIAATGKFDLLETLKRELYHFRLISSERSALATNGSQFGSGFARAALRGRCTGRRFSRRGL